MFFADGVSYDGVNLGGSRFGEANFRFARQPPTIVTWAELDFYDLPLIRPSLNSGRQRFSRGSGSSCARRWQEV
jgi:hypothetical protein